MRPLAFLTGLVTTAGFAAGFAISAQGAARPHALATSNLGFTALSPACIADTRAASAGPACATDNGKTLTPGGSLTIDVPGLPATASTAVVSIAAIFPTSSGFVSAFPAGQSFNNTANINFVANQTVDNLVTVGLGTDASNGNTQAFTIYDGPSNGGNVDVQVDLYGYYAPNSGSAYNPITPARVTDTRSGSGQPNAGMTLGAGANPENVNVQVAGVAGVPSNATAVAVNVALTDASSGSESAPNFIYAYPTGTTPTTPVANQDYIANETLSTEAIVGVGTGGDITVANHTGSVDVVVDIDGYYTATGSLLNMLSSPVRISGANGNSVPNNTSTSVTLQGAGATAGVLNLAECYEGSSTQCPPNVALTGGNFLTAYPTGASVPTAANLNYTTGDISNVLSNAVSGTASSSGGVSVFNGPPTAGNALVFVDEFGYFAPPSSAFSISASPSTQTVGGTQPTITATDTNPSAVGETVFFAESYPTAGGTGTHNDSCVIAISGSCSVTNSGAAGTTVGTENIGAVLDTDFDSDGTNAAFTISNLDPDTDVEPTATTTITWSPGAIAGITAAPGSEDFAPPGGTAFCAVKIAGGTNCGDDGGVSQVVGSTFTGFATLTDTNGNAEPGVPVTFEVEHATTTNYENAGNTCDPESDITSGCTLTTLTGTTNSSGVASASWSESGEGEDYFWAFPTGKSSLTSNMGEVIWGTQPLTITPDYTANGTAALDANATYTVSDSAVPQPGDAKCVELAFYQNFWNNGAQGNANQTTTHAVFTGVGGGGTAFTNSSCTTGASFPSIAGDPNVIYVIPPSGGSFTFTATSATSSDTANPFALAESSDFNFTACDGDNTTFCGPVAVGQATTWGNPLSAYNVSVTPTTNASAALGALVKYTEAVTVNGTPDTTDLNSFTFQQLLAAGASLTSTPGEVGYTETTVNSVTYCVPGAHACPAADTAEASGTPFTPAGSTTPITMTNSAYNGVGTDTQVQVVGTGTFSPSITDNSGAGPSSNGTGPATTFGYVDLNSNGKFDSATEPSGTGGTSTFTSPVPASMALVPVNGPCTGVGTGFPVAADQFSNGNYYHPAESNVAQNSGADGSTTAASTTIGSASLFTVSGQYVGWDITDSKGVIPANTTIATNGGAGTATISHAATSTVAGDTFTVSTVGECGRSGDESNFGLVAEVLDQSGQKYGGTTVSAVTWTLKNTGGAGTTVSLDAVQSNTGGSEHLYTAPTSPDGSPTLGTTSLFPNPENSGTSNATFPAATSLQIASGASLSFTTYTATGAFIACGGVSLDCGQTSGVVVNSLNATTLSVTAQLATDPSGTAVAGSALGSSQSATVGWAPQPAAGAGSNVSGTITAFDPVETTETEASGTLTAPGSDAILVQTVVGLMYVQYDMSGVTNSYTVSSTTTTEAGFEGALADGKTYTMTSYHTSTQANTIS